MSTLFGINISFLKLIAKLQDNEGDFTDEINEELALNRDDFTTKAEDYINSISHIEDENDANKANIKRLQSKIKTNESIIARLKANLMQGLHLYHLSVDKKGVESYKVKLPNLNLTMYTQKNTHIEVTSEFNDDSLCLFELGSLTKDELDKVKQVLGENIGFKRLVSKTLIQTALDEGKEVKGAYVVSDTSLRTK